MTKILAIGNSFSSDALHYLHRIAQADGVELTAANLYIGGCSLETHWKNIESGAADYLLELNGRSAERYVDVDAALSEERWDYITLQQASPDSGFFETYEPYLQKIAAHVREKAPGAEILIHQTWAYEQDSMHSAFEKYGYSQEEMYQRLRAAYDMAAAALSARVIRCGDAVQGLRKIRPFVYFDGGMSLCRDGHHMNVIYGRYLTAAVWYRTLFGKSLSDNSYIPSTDAAPGARCNTEILDVIRRFVDGFC